MAEPIDTAPMQPGHRRSRWWWVAAVVIIGALVAGGTYAASRNSRAAAAPLAIASARAFDPQSLDHVENDDQVPLAVDASATTAWQSEHYGDGDFPAGKTGVGIIVVLAHRAQVSTMNVVSADAGWSASVYVSTGPGPDDLAGWGTPVGQVASASAGSTRIDVKAGQAQSVLVWFTKVPAAGIMHVADLAVQGR